MRRRTALCAGRQKSANAALRGNCVDAEMDAVTS
jgi:hypothetical protein